MANNDQPEVDMVCRMETFAKSFSLKIVGYSLMKQLQPESGTVAGIFDFAGHTWTITFSSYGSKHGKSSDCLKLLVSLLTETKTTMGLDVLYSLFDHRSGRYSDEGVNAAVSYGKVSKQGDGIMTDNFMKTHIFEQSDYMKDDYIVLKFSMKLVTPFCIEAGKKQVMWDSREGADVVVQVGAETFSLHRTVLAAHSPVFKAELFGPMLESNTKCVKIEDIKPEVFKLMLNFMYTDVLPPKDEEVSFEMAQHLLVAADRYGLEMLKLFCLEKLIGSLDVHNATVILAFSDKHNFDLLMEICLDLIASSVKTLQAVMATDGFKPLMENSPSMLHKLLEKVDCESYILSFLGIRT